MSFATLEEAWGVPRFSADNARLSDDDHRPSDHGSPGHGSSGHGSPDHGSSGHGSSGHGRRRDPSRSFPRPFNGDLPDAPPRSEAEDTQTEETRRFLARTYARYGVQGLLRLMPREALPRLGGGRRHGGPGLWDAVARALSKPENVLFLLVAMFAVVVVWDALKPGAGAVQPSLASLHMSPFPLGTSSM